ncbi:MAG: DUF2807 domain-containing protein [Bacteroidales bacterium]|nr:DUF2807 domain-containing protein [Bacteroidales bacterium]
MNNRVLVFVICTFALIASCFVAPAQTKQVSHDFSAFDALDVDYDFDVRVVDSRNYSVSLNVQDVLKDYVKVYVKNHTLYITLDEKSLPSDVRKMFRGRKSDGPVLEATVHMPEPLSAVKMAGSSTLSVNYDLECKDFRLDLEESARVKQLTVDAGTVTVTAAGKSYADLVLYADEIKLNVSGNSLVEFEQDSESLDIVAGGSSEVRMEGETLNASLTTSGSSRVTLNGKTSDLTVTGSGSSNIDAINLKASECSVKLSNSCKVYEAATETIHVDMTGNSTLVFDGDPVIDIINVKSSTLQRYSNVKH